MSPTFLLVVQECRMTVMRVASPHLLLLLSYGKLGRLSSAWLSCSRSARSFYPSIVASISTRQKLLFFSTKSFDEKLSFLDAGEADDDPSLLIDGLWTEDDSDAETLANAQLDNVVDPLLEEYHKWYAALDKSIESLTKKQTSLENELSKAQTVEETVARAQLLTANLYLFKGAVQSCVVQDWENDQEVEITLDPSFDSASQEADALFIKARKLKRGSRVVQDLLEETSLVLSQFRDVVADFDAASSENGVDENAFRLVQGKLLRLSQFTPPKVQDIRPASKGPTSIGSKPLVGTPASNLRKLVSPAGCTILIGRNRRGNENLSMSIARGNDIWMHSRGCPGAHVLLQQRRGSVPVTESCMQLAADLAIFYSDARNEQRAPVTAALPKHILKPRGAPPGAVKLREEWRVLVGYPNKVPLEFKEAREESGLTNEYRAADKAKRRKRKKK
jgi:hypothetical protein